MNYLFALVLALASSVSYADCIDEIFYFNDDRLWISMGFQNGCYQGPLMLQYRVKTSADDQSGTPEQVLFNDECPNQRRDGEFITEFTCNTNGRSPLAGAHYLAKPYNSSMECDGETYEVEMTVYECVDGCREHTPKQLELPNPAGGC